MVDKLLQINTLVIPANDLSVSGFVFNHIKDWYSGSTGDPTQDRRDSGDGFFEELDMGYNGLVVSFEGVCVDEDIVALARKKGKFAALRRGGATIPVSYTDPLGKTTRHGKVISTPIPHSSDLTSFKWAIDILCHDPLRYGDTVTSSNGVPVDGGGLVWPITYPITWAGGSNDGRVSIINTGTATAWPRFRVTGGLSDGVRLLEVGTGRELWVDRVIPLGSTIEVDSSLERVTIDGANNDITQTLRTEQWWGIEPGQTSVVQFVPLGSQTGTPMLYVDLEPSSY